MAACRSTGPNEHNMFVHECTDSGFILLGIDSFAVLHRGILCCRRFRLRGQCKLNLTLQRRNL